MAVIWGLDLKEIQWSKFKSSNMWNNIYHRRRTKFLVYQLAMILCVVSESLGTDVLSKYTSNQRAIERNSNGATTEHNNDIVGAFSFNIFVGVFIATIFGSAFFFDLFWPEREESVSVKLAWKICSVLACVLALASALLLTVLLSTHKATLSGSPTGSEMFKAPLDYKKNGEAIASVCLIWPGWLATIWSTVLLFYSLDHINKNGPLSKIGKSGGKKEKEDPTTEASTQQPIVADAGHPTTSQPQAPRSQGTV